MGSAEVRLCVGVSFIFACVDLQQFPVQSSCATHSLRSFTTFTLFYNVPASPTCTRAPRLDRLALARVAHPITVPTILISAALSQQIPTAHRSINRRHRPTSVERFSSVSE